MSGVAVLRYLLANDAPLVAVVPATKIFAGAIPLGTAVPAIGVAQISGVERPTVAMAAGAKRHRTDRVQVTVEAGTYASQKSLLELVRTACGHQTGTLNGVDLMSVLPDGQGPDFYDADARIYSQSCDFLVSWRTP